MDDKDIACAKMIDKAIQDSYNGDYRYDLKAAVNTVIAEYGTERMNFVLANTLQDKDYDGRFSKSNKEWAKAFDIPQDGQNYRFSAQTHPAILDGFINRTRQICTELAKEQKQEKPSIVTQIKETAKTVSQVENKTTHKKRDELEV